MESKNQTHIFEPVYNYESKILILGTFPSVKSRENHFYYGHPQNRFWKVISSLYKYPLPVTIEEKKAMLLNCHVAVWDVIHSCDIAGSSDSSIKNVVPNNLGVMLKESSIDRIYANGNTAAKLYRKYMETETGIEAITLPSTSPANASYSLEKLLESWKEIVTSSGLCYNI